MRVLAIETSCDETGVAVVEAEGAVPTVSFRTLGNALYSQSEIHAKYGGVFPMLAKREHAANLAPLALVALKEARCIEGGARQISDEIRREIEGILSREEALIPGVLELARMSCPAVDAIAVTAGPGLEPALWVGINFARALGLAWGLPVIPVNHMEAHLLSSLLREGRLDRISLPVLALLISGGHTEFVLMKDWFSYDVLGSTRDDAVGEAFDKVARLLELPYPGGPQISALAEQARTLGETPTVTLPRPMVKSTDLDFSFSGLKTAVLYALEGRVLDEKEKRSFALEFENAAAETLASKTKDALERSGAKTFVIGGGVAANRHIRGQLKKLLESSFEGVDLRLPDPAITGDNALMIGVTGALHLLAGKEPPTHIAASGNLSF